MQQNGGWKGVFKAPYSFRNIGFGWCPFPTFSAHKAVQNSQYRGTLGPFSDPCAVAVQVRSASRPSFSLVSQPKKQQMVWSAH